MTEDEQRRQVEEDHEEDLELDEQDADEVRGGDTSLNPNARTKPPDIVLKRSP